MVGKAYSTGRLCVIKQNFKTDQEKLKLNFCKKLSATTPNLKFSRKKLERSEIC